MPDQELDYRIVDGIVRMILIKTLPGRELQAGRNIETQCQLQGINATDYRVFRLLGDYDLAFVYDNARISEDEFVKLGTLPYITATSEYLCYKWGSESFTSFNIGALDEPLVSICFLKINPRITRKFGIRSEVDFVKYLQENSKLQIVGTLGWFEIIIFASKKSMYSILNDVHNEIMSLVYQYGGSEGEHYGFPEKTLSLIGHELDVSDPTVNTKRSLVPMFHSKLKRDSVAIDVTLSCRPRAMPKLYRKAKEYFGVGEDETPENVRMLYGPRDIFVQVPLADYTTFNDIICRLDEFRNETQDQLVKTHTHIQYRKGEFPGFITDPETFMKEETPAIPLFKISSEQSQELVRKSTETAEVVSAVYRYNNYIENSLIADAFLDLLKFVWATKSIATGCDKTPSIETRQRMVDRLRILREGVEQRSQGVYVGVDESPFALNATGLGLGRALKGIEAYVHSVLLRVGVEWSGFILSGSHSRYEHLEESIIMPTNALLNPNNQWEITHEAMHILQYHRRREISVNNIFNEKSKMGRTFTAPSSLRNLILEILADLYDYVFCCPLAIEKYIQVVWDYLSQAIFKDYNERQVRDYMYRTFTVIAYEYHVKSEEKSTGQKYREQLRRKLKDSRIYFDDYKHLLSDKHTDKEAYNRLVNDYVVDMHQVLPKLYESIDIINREKVVVSSDDTDSIIEDIWQGKIISSKRLTNPEAIVWCMAANKTDQMSSNASIAWLLSLWNMYYLNQYEENIDIL